MSRSAYTRLQIIFSLVLTVLLKQTICNLNAIKCNRCSDHDIACASQSQYYKCQDGIILSDVLHDCPENHVCTHKFKNCVERSKFAPVCPLTQASFCGVCAKWNPNNGTTNGNKISFACVGLNHYKICRGNAISNDITFNCHSGTVCSIRAFEETDQICVSKSVLSANNYSASCPDTSELQTKGLEKACLQYERRANIICFNLPNPYDSKCESYLHCNRVDDHFQVRIVKCVQGFYNVLYNKCIKEHPSVCGQTKVENLTATTSSLTNSSSTGSSSTESVSTNSPLTDSSSLSTESLATNSSQTTLYSTDDSSLPTSSSTDSSSTISAFKKLSIKYRFTSNESTPDPKLINAVSSKGFDNNSSINHESKSSYINRLYAQNL